MPPPGAAAAPPTQPLGGPHMASPPTPPVPMGDGVWFSKESFAAFQKAQLDGQTELLVKVVDSVSAALPRMLNTVLPLLERTAEVAASSKRKRAQRDEDGDSSDERVAAYHDGDDQQAKLEAISREFARREAPPPAARGGH